MSHLRFQLVRLRKHKGGHGCLRPLQEEPAQPLALPQGRFLWAPPCLCQLSRRRQAGSEPRAPRVVHPLSGQTHPRTVCSATQHDAMALSRKDGLLKTGSVLSAPIATRKSTPVSPTHFSLSNGPCHVRQ